MNNHLGYGDVVRAGRSCDIIAEGALRTVRDVKVYPDGSVGFTTQEDYDWYTKRDLPFAPYWYSLHGKDYAFERWQRSP